MPGLPLELPQGGREGSSVCSERQRRRAGWIFLPPFLRPTPLLPGCEIMFRSRQQSVKAPHAQAQPPPPSLSCLVNLMALKRKQS